MPAKTKSAKQVRYLESSSSPLTGAQKAKMNSEIRSGKVKIKKKAKKR